MNKPLTVASWMTTEVHTLNRNDRLSVADDLLSMERIRHLPVLDEDGSLAGIVSQRDLFRGSLARALGYGETAQQKLLDMLVVKEVMTIQVETVAPDAPLAEAAARMVKKGIGSLVVVDGDHIVGILTEGDFVRRAAGS